MPVDRRSFLIGGALLGASACAKVASTSTRTSAHRPTGSPARTSPVETTTPSPSPTRPAGPAREISHGARRSRNVALTFHVAGDLAVVDAVLSAADRAQARLTMLMVGTWLQANPRVAHRIVAAGHDIGNHTWSHPVLLRDDRAQTLDEIRRCQDLLVRLTGHPGRWFRPSGTPHATSLMLSCAGERGYPTSLSYDVDPLDYTNPGADAVVSRTLAQARGGSIISLHTLYPGTADALPRVIAGLRRNGLNPVAASQLLAGAAR